MALYIVYATKEELASYLNIPLIELPDNSEKLLKRASELVKQITLNNINPINKNHLEAASLATCAQVEYWLEMGENVSIIGNINNFSLDDLSMNFGNNNSEKGSLCVRARAYLNQQGLLYRGV